MTEQRNYYHFSDSTKRVRRNMLISSILMLLISLFGIKLSEDKTIKFLEISFNTTETIIFTIIIIINIYNTLYFFSSSYNDNYKVINANKLDSNNIFKKLLFIFTFKNKTLEDLKNDIQYSGKKSAKNTTFINNNILSPSAIENYEEAHYKVCCYENYKLQQVFINIEYRIPFLISLFFTIIVIIRLF